MTSAVVHGHKSSHQTNKCVSFQKMWKIHVLVLFLIVSLTNFAQCSKYSEITCIRACTYPGKTQQCDLCGDDPPIGYTMCVAACRDRKYDEVNVENLDKICTTCFENKKVITTVCRHNCGHSGGDKRKRICWMCDYYEIKFRGGWF